MRESIPALEIASNSAWIPAFAGMTICSYRLTRRELTIRPALSVTTSSSCPARSRTVRTVWPAVLAGAWQPLRKHDEVLHQAAEDDDPRHGSSVRDTRAPAP